MSGKETWWKQRINEFVSIWKSGFPYFVLVLGIVMIFLGMTSVFKGTVVNEIVSSIGKVFTGSGLFTFMIKSFQYTGVFKEELTKIIFEPKFIKNRKDLPLHWEKVSKELFKNIFPKISDKITKDVKETYLPTETVQYYDDVKHTVDIEMIDTEHQVIKVKDTVKMLLYPIEAKKEFPHSYRNKITCVQNDPHTTLKVISFIVNNEEYIGTKKITTSQHWNDGNLITSYDVTLKGRDCYEVTKVIEKTYSLKSDNTIFVKNDCIRNNVNIKIFFKGVVVEFYDIGTLKSFENVLERDGYIEMNYDGIIYPKQGYLVILKNIN